MATKPKFDDESRVVETVEFETETVDRMDRERDRERKRLMVHSTYPEKEAKKFAEKSIHDAFANPEKHKDPEQWGDPVYRPVRLKKLQSVFADIREQGDRYTRHHGTLPIGRHYGEFIGPDAVHFVGPVRVKMQNSDIKVREINDQTAWDQVIKDGRRKAKTQGAVTIGVWKKLERVTKDGGEEWQWHYHFRAWFPSYPTRVHSKISAATGKSRRLGGSRK